MRTFRGWIVAIALTSCAVAQEGTFPMIVLPYPLESGQRANPTSGIITAHTELVSLPGAGSLQLLFSSITLNSPEDAVIVTSLSDGQTQVLDALRLKQWRNCSAWFRGPALSVSLRLGPQSEGEFTLDRVAASAPDGRDDLCGGDDRVASGEQRVCRLVTPTAATLVSTCTGWLINDRSTILTAGHCTFSTSFGTMVAQFNVPLSGTDGSLNAPPVADQYPIDLGSVMSQDGGVGDDWAVLRLHPNSLGETAAGNQGFFTLATSLPPNNTTLRLTGFGSDNTPNQTVNATCQTSTGPLDDVDGTEISHEVDSMGGNSGGPLINASTGQAIGIHTHGGCDVFLGFGTNGGTSILHPALQSAITTVSGCTALPLLSSTGQNVACTPAIFNVAPAANRWHVVGISSPSDWDLSIAGTASALAGNACDFLVANGHNGAVGPNSGRMLRFSGSSSAWAQADGATTVTIGTPRFDAFFGTSVVELFEFNVTAPGNHTIEVTGDASLQWHLYSPGTNASWRPRGNASLLRAGSVANGVETVSLAAGWHGLVVFKNNGAGSLSTTALTVSVCTSTPSLFLPAGTPQAISNACQPFSVGAATVANTWSAVAIAGADDWDLDLGAAQSHRGGNECDFAVANGTAGAVSPVSGVFTRHLGFGGATAQHETATAMTVGTPFDASLAAGRIARVVSFTIATAGSYTFTLTGDPSLRWALYLPGSDGNWRPRSDATLNGSVGGLSSGFLLNPGSHAFVISHDGPPAAVFLPFTINVCPLASTLNFTFVGQGFDITNTCQPVRITASTAGNWAAFGAASASDWDVTFATVESQSASGITDFVVANAHNGSIIQTEGLVARFSGTTNARAQLASLSTVTVGGSVIAGWGATTVLWVFQFNVATAGSYDVNVSGLTPLSWRLYRPGTNAAWRTRAAADFSGASGTLTSGLQLSPGWHALVVFRDGASGPSGNLTVNIGPTPNPLPSLSSLNPASALAGAGALTLSVSGSQFLPSSVVRWNGASLPTTLVSASQLTATVSASLLATAGTASVTVFTPAPGGGTSAPRSFSVNNPAPVLTSLSPNGAPAGSPATTVLANGSGFGPQSVVSWNATALVTTFVSATQLSAQVPASMLLVPGNATLSVSSPAPGGGASTGLPFTLVAPVIAAIQPQAIAIMTAASPPAALTITGANFLPTTRIVANGEALATTFVSATQLAATLTNAIPQATRAGGIALNAENATDAVSNTAALVVGAGANRGTVRRHPLITPPGQPYAALVEGGTPNALFSLYADFFNPVPVTSFPNAAGNFVLAVGPYAGSPGPFLPVIEGIGLHGPPSGTTLDANGGFALPGFVAPNPALGLSLTVQGLYLDAAAPLGFRMTWARWPDRL